MGRTTKAGFAVALVDPLPCMRAGLTLYLERSGNYRVVLSVATGEELIAALEGGTAVDLVLMDVRPPSGDGFAVLAWLREQRPDVRAVAYGLPADDGSVVRSFRSGAGAMLSKDMDEALLVLAVDVVQRAAVFHTAHTQQVLLDNPDGLSAEERYKQRLLAQLTKRQLEVLVLLCREDCPSSGQIGKALGISSRTVDDHVEELFEIFEVNKRTKLTRAAQRLGLA